MLDEELKENVMNDMACIFMVIVAHLSASALAQDSHWEAQAAVEAYYADNGLWDNCTGGEAKLVYWRRPDLGLAFCGGVSQWSVDGKTEAVSSDRWQSIASKGQYTSFGLSAIKRIVSDYGPSLCLEGGLRYMLYDSNLKLVEIDRVLSGAGQFTDIVTPYEFDCDDTYVARLSLGLEWPFGRDVRVCTSAGYQLDLDVSTASVTTLSNTWFSQDIDVSVFFLQLGVFISLR